MSAKVCVTNHGDFGHGTGEFCRFREPGIRAPWSIHNRHVRSARMGDLLLWVEVKSKRLGLSAKWWVLKSGVVYMEGEVHPGGTWRYESFEREAMFRAEQAAASIPDGGA